jgi:hypothetical protein
LLYLSKRTPQQVLLPYEPHYAPHILNHQARNDYFVHMSATLRQIREYGNTNSVALSRNFCQKFKYSSRSVIRTIWGQG